MNAGKLFRGVLGIFEEELAEIDDAVLELPRLLQQKSNGRSFFFEISRSDLLPIVGHADLDPIHDEVHIPTRRFARAYLVDLLDVFSFLHQFLRPLCKTAVERVFFFLDCHSLVKSALCNFEATVVLCGVSQCPHRGFKWINVIGPALLFTCRLRLLFLYSLSLADDKLSLLIHLEGPRLPDRIEIFRRGRITL